MPEIPALHCRNAFRGWNRISSRDDGRKREFVAARVCIQGSKWSKSQLSGEERSGREGEGIRQLDATSGYSEGGRTRGYGRSHFSRM